MILLASLTKWLLYSGCINSDMPFVGKCTVRYLVCGMQKQSNIDVAIPVSAHWTQSQLTLRSYAPTDGWSYS